MNVQQALALARPDRVGEAPTYSLEAQLLLAEIAGRDRAWILAHPEWMLTRAQATWYRDRLTALQAGTPLAYLLGRKEFYGRPFLVNRHTLIPRPETEQVVEIALAYLRTRQDPVLAADVGAGSGCIGITLACEHPGMRVIAVDRSFEALQLARENASVHRVSARVQLLQADLLAAFHKRLGLICANLPYIPTRRMLELPVSRFEPRAALDGGEDGMRLTEELLLQLVDRLQDQGSAVLEIDEGQGGPLGRLASRLMPDRPVSVYKDGAGFERVLVIGPEGG